MIPMRKGDRGSGKKEAERCQKGVLATSGRNPGGNSGNPGESEQGKPAGSRVPESIRGLALARESRQSGSLAKSL